MTTSRRVALRAISCARSLFLVAFVVALACANANVTGDNNKADPNDPSQPNETPTNPPGGDTPVTVPVDGNGVPQVGNIGLRYIGRANNGNVLSWSGSAYELNFAGTDASFTFHTLSGQNYLGLTVDGTFQGNITVQDGQAIALGPYADGNHIARLTKLNEAKLGTLNLQSFSTTGSLNVPQYASRRIEVIGDSIASAYGIDGNGPACVNTAATENALKAFPTLLSNAFNADVSVISYAGRGVRRNDISDTNNTLPVMPQLWTRTTANSNNNTYQYSASSTPDVFVVMLGTNDYEYMQNNNGTLTQVRAALDQQNFVIDFNNFVNSLLTAAPSAKVLLCGSPLLSDTYPSSSDMQHTNLATNLNAVVNNIGNAQQVRALNVNTLVDAQKTGCGGHPNRTAHQQMAATIGQALSDWLGW